MKFTLVIACDNAAFNDNPNAEITRILGVLADSIADDGPLDGAVHDINGNTVGRYTLTGD